MIILVQRGNNSNVTYLSAMKKTTRWFRVCTSSKSTVRRVYWRNFWRPIAKRKDYKGTLLQKSLAVAREDALQPVQFLLQY